MIKHLSPDNISALSRSHGFCLSGSTNLSPASTVPQFIDWIASGHHGSMLYLQNNPGYDIRLHPNKLFPGAKSILFLGARYPKNSLEALPSPLQGVISSYAWSKDYHEVLRARAQSLVDELSIQTGRPIHARITVDSAPVLEKPLAQRAGFGWQGRNTCLISPTKGSLFFIVGIFLNIPLEPDPPFEKDHCGTCRKCMDACPTGCILPDRTIDARRCISYLTIEHKGFIPLEIRPHMGNMIFGCDICQNVCPWNKKVDNTEVLEEFLPGTERMVSPELIKVLALQPDEFNQLYRQSPIRRTKRVGFLRNAAIALGNSHLPEAFPALKTVMQTEPEPIIRSHAAWALGMLNSSKVWEFLSDARNRETNETVLFEIERVLSA